VRAAFGDVEDGLATLRILADESVAQRKAVRFARRSVDLALDQYCTGLVNYVSAVGLQATAFTPGGWDRRSTRGASRRASR
jgi:outer membrane protein TolC